MPRSWHDLVTEPPDGRYSYTKVWGHAGGLTLCAGFLKVCWSGEPTYDIFIGYAFGIAVVTSPALASKLMGLRYGQTPPANGNGEVKK